MAETEKGVGGALGEARVKVTIQKAHGHAVCGGSHRRLFSQGEDMI